MPRKKSRSKELAQGIATDVGTDVAGAVAGTAIGSIASAALLSDPAIGAMFGGTIGAVLTDIGKRFISPKEQTRIDIVANLAAQQIQKRLSDGLSPKEDVSKEQLGAILEGSLLAARDSYEEKKLPLLANLASVAAFTGTPIENMIQTLHMIETLSYRQLCILSCIGWRNLFQEDTELPSNPVGNMRRWSTDEYVHGVYVDLFRLISLNLVEQISSFNADDRSYNLEDIRHVTHMIPSKLVLSYSGRLVYNGSMLDQINKLDFEPILKVLKRQN